ncbi:MAG: nitrous oxide-stimulated promoter family protein [Treponema sp.]
MKNVNTENEKALVDAMIDLYAKAHPQAFDAEVLKAYAHKRVENCRYRNAEGKPFCNVCPVHCYKPEMREHIRAVMRYSGPRMLFRHPLLSLAHLIGTIRSKGHVSKLG